MAERIVTSPVGGKEKLPDRETLGHPVSESIDRAGYYPEQLGYPSLAEQIAQLELIIAQALDADDLNTAYEAADAINRLRLG